MLKKGKLGIYLKTDLLQNLTIESLDNSKLDIVLVIFMCLNYDWLWYSMNFENMLCMFNNIEVWLLWIIKIYTVSVIPWFFMSIISITNIYINSFYQ